MIFFLFIFLKFVLHFSFCITSILYAIYRIVLYLILFVEIKKYLIKIYFKYFLKKYFVWNIFMYFAQLYIVHKNVNRCFVIFWRYYLHTYTFKCVKWRETFGFAPRARFSKNSHRSRINQQMNRYSIFCPLTLNARQSMAKRNFAYATAAGGAFRSRDSSVRVPHHT